MQNSFKIMPSGLKGNIIEVISNNKSLSAKQIYLKLKRQYAITSTYQAMHKTLKQMMDEEILVKTNNSYSINLIWVQKFKQNIDTISEKISSEKPEINLSDLTEGETIHLHFNGILEVGWFLVDKLMIAPNPKNKPGIALWRLCYSLIGLDSKHLDGLKKACKQNDWHVFVEENNKVNKMFGDTMISYGVKNVKYGVKCSTPLSDKVIIGDYVSEIIYPSLFRKIWTAQYRLSGKLIEFNLAKHLFNMRDLQMNIEVILTKNAKLAEEYRKEYLK